MHKLSINTPQNVKFEYNLASLGSRIIAFAMDYFIIMCYAIMVYYMESRLGLFNTGDPWLTAGIYMLILLPAFFYPLLMETFFNGQTIGKMIMRIKVVKIDGTRATIYQYFIRWYSSSLTFFYVQER